MLDRHQAFLIVGVGASAGGVEAIEGFFRGMPSEPGIAIVVVTHLNPDRESVLHEIIGRYTELAVHVASDGREVKPDCVYVAPSNAIVTMAGGRLHLRKSDAASRERKPIDIFLSSLAIDRGECSAAIILSGLDSDGTLGTKAVKERGGLTMAQIRDGHGPSHPDMPDSAIAAGFVDFAIPVDEMGGKLVQVARSLSLLDGIAAESEDAEGDEKWDNARREIYAILRNQIAHDFSGYKPKTFLRRVDRRMQVVELATLDAYIARLREDPKEVAALFRDLLINVTSFFRDAEAFETLGNLVIPKLFEGRGAEDTVRIWVPGCATGEEVFTIAILMREHMDGLSAIPRVQIFATDIDERALGAARLGRYPEALLEGVSPERRRRFFITDGASYVVTKDVRDLCIFSPHSVIRDPPFSRIDLVSCRNLLIYFGPDVQSHVIPIFHYSLKPGGYLFLGLSENVNQFGEMFAPVEKRHRIFRSRPGAGAPVRLPMAVNGLVHTAMGRDDRDRRRTPVAGLAWRHNIESHVLDRFAPPYVVATREGDVIYFSGRTGKYLEQIAGAPSNQLLAIARKGLRYDLRMAFRDAVQTGKTVVRQKLAVEGDTGGANMTTLTVEPVLDPNDTEALFLVVFSDEPAAGADASAGSPQSSAEAGAAHLEKELVETKERLQSLVEEYETALEELKSANEELVSVNEELQSTNEEHEASKEELQSLNEELQTVNIELANKVDALDRANADLHNLFESTQVATVFLDKNLIIRSYTPAVTRIFNILPGDRGRPITDLASRLLLPGLGEDVRSVLASGDTIEHRIDHADHHGHYLVRILAYRDAHGRPDGVVVTFIDVTSLAESEDRQRMLVAELNHRVKNMLTVAISIAELTFRSSTSAEAFKTTFVARLRAMARSYELLSRENWTNAGVHELIGQELAPFGRERITAEGPELRLKPPEAMSFGMILHELVTNAGKYGALSVEDGRVSLTWCVEGQDGAGRVKLLWKEHDGPETSTPARTGFGLKLIEREVSFSLGGSSAVAFETDGLKMTIDFPLGRTVQH
ncbi:MAG: CheR family methyltransferase [Rhizomicrobium sp.]